MMSKNETNSDKNRERQRSEDFFRLFMASQRRIYTFILMLVPDCNDADDLMQEVASVMWSKFDDFEQGTNFAAWGVQIARYIVINYRRKLKNTHVHFTDKFFDGIVDYAAENTIKGERLEMLKECLKKLSDANRQLIQMHYTQELTVKRVAELTGRSVNTLYKVMSQIHDSLLQCVRRNLAAEEGA